MVNGNRTEIGLGNNGNQRTRPSDPVDIYEENIVYNTVPNLINSSEDYILTITFNRSLFNFLIKFI